MKKILFVVPSLQCGGIEMAFINLINQKFIIDCDDIIFLKVLSGDGIYYDKIPKNIKIINNSKIENYIFATFKKSVFSLLQNKKNLLAIKRVLAAIFKYFLPFHQDQILWYFLKNDISKDIENYDIAIAYADARTTYYVADKINARKKICWIHTDHDKAKFNYKFDRQYYKQYSKIVCVSKYLFLKESKEIEQSKLEYIYNFVPVDKIMAKSFEKIEDKNFFDTSIRILTIGRLSHEKGFDLAIKTAKLLSEGGLKFRWFFIGDGPEFYKLLNLIKKYKLDNYITILGYRSNPYKYIRNCNIYVQPSRYEGFSTTVMEAIVLSKKIVITNVAGASEQQKISKNVYISEFDTYDLKQKILQVLNSKSKNTKLKNINTASENQIIKLLELRNEK